MTLAVAANANALNKIKIRLLNVGLWWQPSRLLLERVAGETPAATAEFRDRGSRLGQKRRSVRAQAPVQFRERRFTGWPGIESCRFNRNFRRKKKYEFAKIEKRKIDQRGRDSFQRHRRGSSKNFAALGGRWFLLRLRLGMKRATAGRLSRFRNRRIQRAMIRKRDPGTNRDRDDQARCGRSHAD